MVIFVSADLKICYQIRLSLQYKTCELLVVIMLYVNSLNMPHSFLLIKMLTNLLNCQFFKQSFSYWSRTAGLAWFG